MKSPTWKDCQRKVSSTAAAVSNHSVRIGRLALEEIEFHEQPFVGITISGGGSRAVNFAIAAIEELERRGLIGHLSAISSTSGGSLAAAYYLSSLRGLNWLERGGSRADSVKAALAHNFESNTLWRGATRAAFTSQDRTYRLEQEFQKVFPSLKTYRNLNANYDSSAIRWIANATNTTHGEHFMFTEEQFHRLGVSLADYPVARAISASSAFPGLLNNVSLPTYQAYFHPPEPQAPKEDIFFFEQQYVHLMDGGPSDNLGLEAILQMAAYRAKRLKETPTKAGLAGHCTIFAIDAYPEGAGPENQFLEDDRTGVGRLIDLNVLAASDIMLSTARIKQLTAIGVLKGDSGRNSDRAGRRDTRLSTDVANVPLSRGHRLAHFALPDVELDARGNVMVKGEGPQSRVDQRVRSAVQVEADCLVWHIAFEHLTTVEESPEDLERRLKVRLLAGQTATRWKLVGPRNCRETDLQNNLFVAARTLIGRDKTTLAQVCNRLRVQGLPIAANCTQLSEPLESAPRITAAAQYVNVLEHGGSQQPPAKVPGDWSVRCVRGENPPRDRGD